MRCPNSLLYVLVAAGIAMSPHHPAQATDVRSVDGPATQHNFNAIWWPFNAHHTNDKMPSEAATAGEPDCTASITLPAGGETYVAGTTMEIAWQSPATTGDVSIDLLRSGVLHTRITSRVPLSDGGISWEICPPAGDAGDYTIRVMTRDCNPGQEWHTNPFTITGSAPVPTATLTSDFGGQTIAAGSTQIITWDTTNPWGTVRIALENCCQLNDTLAWVPMSDGQFEWTVCTSLPNDTDYVITMIATDCNRDIWEFTGEFEIAGAVPPPTVTLTWPPPGEVLQAGTPHTITWDTTDPDGDVLVRLFRNGALVTNFAFVPMSDGQYVWPICATLGDGADYALQLWSFHCSGNIETTGEPFEIVGSLPPPTFTLTSPVEGEQLVAGTTHTVTWDTTDPYGAVSVIWDRHDGSPRLLVGTARMADGRIDWAIPECAANDLNYSLELRAAPCGPYFPPEQVFFEITGVVLPPPSVVMTSPLPGEHITAGMAHSITWNVTNPTGLVTVSIVDDRVLVASLGQVPMSDGGIEWDVCPGVGDGDAYSIHLLSSCGFLVDGDDFSIVGSSQAPETAITSPVGGETYLAGTTQTITWETANAFGDAVVLVQRDGVTTSVVDVVPYATGTLEWTIDPRLETSGNYRIALVDLSCGTFLLAGNFFTIEARRPGDVNGDGDTDLDDHRLLTGCLRGPAETVEVPCREADFTGDATVDLADVATLLAGFSP